MNPRQFFLYIFTPLLFFLVIQNSKAQIVPIAEGALALTEEVWTMVEVASPSASTVDGIAVSNGIGRLLTSGLQNTKGALISALTKVGNLAGGAIALASADGSIQITASSSGYQLAKLNVGPAWPSAVDPLTSGSTCWANGYTITAGNPCYSSPGQAIYDYYFRSSNNANQYYTVGSCSSTGVCGVIYTSVDAQGQTHSSLLETITAIALTSGITCANLSDYTDGKTCIGDTVPPYQTPTTTTTTYSNPADLANSLSPSDLAKPLSPASVVTLGNDIWNDISQDPSYAGPKYNPSSPLTTADIPSNATQPSIGSLLTPDTAGNMTPSPYSQPDQGTGSDTSPDVSNPASSATGASTPEAPPPVVGQPKLEATPTIAMILDPIINILPDLRSFSVPARNIQCPTLDLNFTLAGYQMGGTFTTHCDVIAQWRGTVRTFMSLIADLAVVFIIIG